MPPSTPKLQKLERARDLVQAHTHTRANIVGHALLYAIGLQDGRVPLHPNLDSVLSA